MKVESEGCTYYMPAAKEEEMPVDEKVAFIAPRMMQIIHEGMGLPQDDGLFDTPKRVAKFLLEFSRPFDPIACLKAFDHEDSESGGWPMVAQKGIPVGALCEHHFCPFFGEVQIGYIPDGKVVGLSKLTRLVEGLSHMRPTIQERLNNQIADAISEGIGAKGVIVVVKAQHTCMTVRGVAAPGVVTITSAIRGNFVHVPHARFEFFELLKG